ncbi:MAG: DUF2950 domain-containing protein [Planctomycetota bacterium]|nr:DUF2950 domain-containing protein [Planctomycetota bacterium]
MRKRMKRFMRWSLGIGSFLALVVGAKAASAWWKEAQIRDNERIAIRACKTYAEAQDVFRRTDYDEDGVFEYATRATGQHSLFELQEGAGDLGLIEGEFARAFKPPPEGTPFKGYFFRILTGQGAHAPGGAKSYMVDGNMTLGYGLLAYPDQHGETGRSVLLMNNTGTIYERNWGPRSHEEYSRLTYMGDELDDTIQTEYPLLEIVDADTELRSTLISPVLECSIAEDRNVLWCASSELAWNELREELGGPIEVSDGPHWIASLNRSPFSKSMVDSRAIVAGAGFTPKVTSWLSAQAKARFGDGFTIPGLPDDLPPGHLVAYALLRISLEFSTPFAKPMKPLDFKGREVVSFGLWDGAFDWEALRSQVAVWRYESQNDFIVELHTTSNDERILIARRKPGGTLLDAVRAVIDQAKKPKALAFHEGDRLEVPVFNFEIQKTFVEIQGKALSASGGKPGILERAAQSTRFRLDERGVKLESWASWVVSNGELPNTPRRLVFDGPFLILLARRDAPLPYFALWIVNSELLTVPTD